MQLPTAVINAVKVIGSIYYTRCSLIFSSTSGTTTVSIEQQEQHATFLIFARIDTIADPIAPMIEVISILLQ
jgi:hypothetical protein